MILALCFVSAGLGLIGVVSPSPVVATRGETLNNPTADTFLRRAFHATVILGNYLYIDGGQISQLVGRDPQQVDLQRNSVTLSIDLNSTWTNASVVLNVIPKGSAPILNRETLWKSPEGKSAFVWAGEAAQNGQPPPVVELWELTSDGSGGGQWEAVDVTDTTFPTLARQSTGVGISIGDHGFYFGGYTSIDTDVSVGNEGIKIRPNFVTYNMTSKVWKSASTIGLNRHGAVQYSQAVNIPASGLDERPLIFILGGHDAGLDPQDKVEWTPFSNVTIYDPYIDAWFSQKTTGNSPAARINFCAVSIAGDNGTHEIFVYGGAYRGSSESPNTFSEVYILTIPAFAWFKAPDMSATPRTMLSCEVVGNRQMIAVGGLATNYGPGQLEGLFKEPDVLTQGIGIFDMTALEWRSSYDPNMPPYVSPKPVKEWYLNGGQAAVKWQSKEIARTFIKDATVNVSPTPAATTSSSSASESSNSPKKLGTGDIIGICIGVPAAVLACGSLWYARKAALNREKKILTKALTKYERQEAKSAERFWARFRVRLVKERGHRKPAASNNASNSVSEGNTSGVQVDEDLRTGNATGVLIAPDVATEGSMPVQISSTDIQRESTDRDPVVRRVTA